MTLVHEPSNSHGQRVCWCHVLGRVAFTSPRWAPILQPLWGVQVVLRGGDGRWDGGEKFLFSGQTPFSNSCLVATVRRQEVFPSDFSRHWVNTVRESGRAADMRLKWTWVILKVNSLLTALHVVNLWEHLRMPWEEPESIFIHGNAKEPLDEWALALDPVTLDSGLVNLRLLKIYFIDYAIIVVPFFLLFIPLCPVPPLPPSFPHLSSCPWAII